MKQLATRLSLVLVGSVAIAAGCSSSKATNTDGGGTGNNDTGVTTSNLVPLMPDPTGFVSTGGSGTTMIQGAWYAYGDGIGSDGTNATGDCESKGMHALAECSKIMAPSFGTFPNTVGKMCTSGTAAKVINIVGATMPDYTNIWGAGIGLDLNNGGGDSGTGKLPYNANTNHVLGIAFDIDNVPLGTLRVEFPTSSYVNAAFWGGTGMASPVKMGHNEIRWKDVNGPFYDTAAPVFDPTTILSVQFHIPTQVAASSDYSFCVSNVSAIVP